MNFSSYEPVEKLSDVIPNGRYQAQIVEVKEAQLGSGTGVLNVRIAVKGYPNAVPDTYSIFECPTDEKKRRFWNYNMTRFFDSFGIRRGDWNYNNWVKQYGWVDVTQDWSPKAGKSFASLHPVKQGDPQTQDWKPKDAGQQPQAQEQPKGGVPGFDDFPEDIPFNR